MTDSPGATFLGQPNTFLATQVWIRQMQNGDVAAALANLGDSGPGR